MPTVDPEIWTFSTSFDTAEVKPHDEIPLPVSPIGKRFLITPPTRHDIGSRPMEQGETSSGPSLQYAKRVLKSVMSSWIETLFWSFGRWVWHDQACAGDTCRE